MSVADRRMAQVAPRQMRLGAGTAARVSVLVVLACLFLVPLVWLFLAALKTQGELSAAPIRILPDQAQWTNFKLAVTYFPWLHYAWNSFFLSTVFGTLTMLSSAMVGFGFARLRGWGKNALFLVMLSTIMLPNIATLI